MRLDRTEVRPGELDHERLWSLVGAGAVVAGALAALLAAAAGGAGHVPALTCPFHAITGWPCPACGTTRAALALARGDLLASVRWNPLVLPAVLAAGLYLLYAWSVTLFGAPRWRLVVGARGVAAPHRPRLLAALVVAAAWAWLVIDGR